MGVGDINLIAKIAPKNEAFINIVDASNAGADTTNFDNNLSVADDTVQKALETLDELTTTNNVDGGFSNSVYLVAQLIDGGGA